MSVLVAWTEITTAVALGLCSGLGIAALTIWTKVNAAALLAERGRLDLVIAEHVESKRDCESRCERLENEVKILRATIEDLWKARYESRNPGSGSSPPTSGTP